MRIDKLFNPIIFLGIFAILIGVIPFIFYINYFGFIPTSENAVWGQFGDFVGGILNPIFAFFGFIALLYTVLIQRKEIKDLQSRDKITDIFEIISKISSEIDDFVFKFIDPDRVTIAKLKIINSESHPNYFQPLSKIVMMKDFLEDLEKIDPNSLILRYYGQKYFKVVNKYTKAGWLNDNTKTFL